MAFTLVKYKHLAPSFVEYQEVFLTFPPKRKEDELVCRHGCSLDAGEVSRSQVQKPRHCLQSPRMTDIPLRKTNVTTATRQTNTEVTS